MTDLAARRLLYAEELRTLTGFQSTALFAAFATVPRERFLGQGPWHVLVDVADGHVEYRTTEDNDPAWLYKNVLVAIDRKRRLNNGEPASWARWIEALNIQKGERVVHVGTGTGYYTAVLAECVGSTGHVLGIEVDTALAEHARTNAAHLRHVDIVTGNGGEIALPAADVIVINAGATHLPARWLDALDDGGRLLLPLTGAAHSDEVCFGGMFLITKLGNGYSAAYVSPVGIYPCAGVRDPDYNRLLLQKSDLDWQAVRSIRRDAHEPGATCWLHTPDGCWSTLAS